MKKLLWFLVVLGVVFLDQWTKTWALKNLVPLQTVEVLPMLNWHLAFNTGAAFSFLSDTGPWHRYFFVIFSAVVSLILSVWILRLPAKAKLQSLALSLTLGGAIGNLIDRLMHGHVVDFIDVYYKTNHWPAFNIADSAICLGAFCLLIDMFFHNRPQGGGIKD